MRIPNLTFLLACIALPMAGYGSQPNFVLIVADDLGFSDIGAFGGEIQTPNLDRLAREGLRMRQFYNASRCCPTRASLLTGRYPHQVNLHVNGNSLSPEVPTLAEVLVRNGYHTGMSGKWHLTKTERITGGNFSSRKHLQWLNHQAHYDRFGDLSTYPTSRGFERFYGVIWGVVDYFDPFSLVEDSTPIRHVPEDYYITDAVTTTAVEMIRQYGAMEDPFFIYVAYTAPHWPLHALPEDIAKYRGNYDHGWDVMREERYRRQIAMGLLDPVRDPLPELDRGDRPAWNDLSDRQREREIARMEVHAAMVDRMDQGIGKILSALDESGLRENTVVLFLSDNGASPEEVKKPGYDRPSETRDGRKMKYYDEISAEDFGKEICWGGIGPAWANAANTPYRYWKKEAFDGGNHTPGIISWPRGGIGDGGKFVDVTVHVMDIMPTFLDMAGICYPEEYQGETLKPMDGRSLYPQLAGKAEETERTLYFEHEGSSALFKDHWKLVRMAPTAEWQLFDMRDDRTESTDLADEYTKQVEALDREWQEWYEDVLPERFADNIITQD